MLKKMKKKYTAFINIKGSLVHIYLKTFESKVVHIFFINRGRGGGGGKKVYFDMDNISQWIIIPYGISLTQLK